MRETDLQRWLVEGQQAEIFVEPAKEARFLLERVPWLVSPGAQDRAPARILRNAVVAPFPQLSFFSFDLQAYLFELLHDSFFARVGHLVGMSGAVTCLLALLALHLGTGALLVAAVLFAAWYAMLAERAGLPVWGLAMVPAVAGLGMLGLWLSEALASRPGTLWALWVGFGAFTAFSHIGEPLQPPRTFARDRWSRAGEYLRGEGEGAAPLLARLLYCAWVVFAGVLNELWASQRLLPYNLLFLMFLFGYAPETRAELRERVERAKASGNPALDFVGVGGASYLRSPPPPSQG